MSNAAPVFSVEAWGLIRSNGVPIASRGLSSTRIAIGHYEITLADDFALDDNQLNIIIQADGNQPVVSQYLGGTDNVKTVKLKRTNTGNPVSIDFFIVIERLAIL